MAMTSPPAAPVITRSRVIWQGAMLFEAGVGDRTHLIDADAGQAPGPVETLLNAIATCSATDVLDILAKRRTPVERLGIEIVADRRPEFPRRVRHLDIEFNIDGAGIEPAQAERAVQLSFERYCSVAASLAGDITANARVILNGEPLQTVPLKIWVPAAG
jgi:putative redox protein